jgi:hypothetical protein
MIGFEIIKIMVLFIIAIEGYMIAFEKEKEEDVKSNPRRELSGTFKDPLGYRTNTRGQYVPIKPNSKMIDGVDDDDEV